MAVSETKSVARIARRMVLSNKALSVLVPIPDETPGWNALQNGDLFGSCGVAFTRGIKSGRLTFQRIPMRFVVNETEATGSKLLPAASLG